VVVIMGPTGPWIFYGAGLDILARTSAQDEGAKGARHETREHSTVTRSGT